MRTSTLLIPLALGLLCSPVAHAKSSHYMFGVGPRVGTIVIPGGYPASFPSFDEVGQNGEETGEKIKIGEDTTIEKVRGDMILGVEGLYWADKTNRLAASAGLGLGSGYNDTHLILKYDKMNAMDALDAFVGGGLGVGVANFRGENDEHLRVPYYPIRGEVGAIFRQKTYAIQALIFLNLNLPGRQTLTLEQEAKDGSIEEVEYESGFGWSFYPQLGAELQLLFGDFTKPRNKKKNKNR
jgi:hypothetical protein